MMTKAAKKHFKDLIMRANPQGKAPKLYVDLLKEHNILIAGSVGSGKTVFETGLLYSIFAKSSANDAEVYLIDPKQFELRHFWQMPHVRGYADTPEGALDILDRVESIREARSAYMKQHNLRVFNGSTVYLFIDELADLMTADRPYVREFTDKLVKIMQLGRALKIKVIALTQQPRREVTPARLQVNFTCNVALHCRSAIESRQVVGIPGAELLPQYGQCYISANGFVEHHYVPYITDQRTQELIDWYTKWR